MRESPVRRCWQGRNASSQGRMRRAAFPDRWPRRSRPRNFAKARTRPPIIESPGSRTSGKPYRWCAVLQGHASSFPFLMFFPLLIFALCGPSCCRDLLFQSIPFFLPHVCDKKKCGRAGKGSRPSKKVLFKIWFFPFGLQQNVLKWKKWSFARKPDFPWKPCTCRLRQEYGGTSW